MPPPPGPEPGALGRPGTAAGLGAPGSKIPSLSHTPGSHQVLAGWPYLWGRLKKLEVKQQEPVHTNA